MPLVLKDDWYGFYKEYIVHYWFFEDFDQADFLLKHQADKPRYIPEKNEFLKYVNEYYVDNENWLNVRSFMWDVFDELKYKDISEGYKEVKNYLTYGNGISELGPILDKHNLIFRSEKQFEEFVNLIMLAKNKTRIWENNGYTPFELHEILAKRDKNIIKFPTLQKSKIGRNDTCPCGSGKKYKKCCAMVDDAKTAQLSSEECRLFYETWYGLMGFVNEQKNVIKAKIKTEYPNDISDILIHKVRELLWEEPELIDEYINTTELSKEKIDILKLWRTNHKKGMILILEYQPEYTVAMVSNEQGEDRLYGIKGMTNSIANILQRNLPVQIETVLLPFKDKIIYDGFIGTLPIEYAEGAKLLLSDMHAKAAEHGIITSLQ